MLLNYLWLMILLGLRCIGLLRPVMSEVRQRHAPFWADQIPARTNGLITMLHPVFCSRLVHRKHQPNDSKVAGNNINYRESSVEIHCSLTRFGSRNAHKKALVAT